MIRESGQAGSFMQSLPTLPPRLIAPFISRLAKSPSILSRYSPIALKGTHCVPLS